MGTQVVFWPLVCVMSLIQPEGSEAHTVPLFGFVRGDTEFQCWSNWVSVPELHDDYIKALKEMNQNGGDLGTAIFGETGAFSKSFSLSCSPRNDSSWRNMGAVGGWKSLHLDGYVREHISVFPERGRVVNPGDVLHRLSTWEMGAEERQVTGASMGYVKVPVSWDTAWEAFVKKVKSVLDCLCICYVLDFYFFIIF